jgi:ribonuclease HII
MSQFDIFDVLEENSPAHQSSGAAASLLQYEKALWDFGYKAIAGVDEAGRGPLAGPVVACACILPKGIAFEGVKDSKQLSAVERKRLADLLTGHPEVHWAIGLVSAEKIDQINILRATLLAMQQALRALPSRPDFVLVDGKDCPPINLPKKAIVRGDALSQSIAAASIIAKVRRDEIMNEYHLLWPNYGFDQHKGYGTPGHLRAVQVYGLCPIHRKSFAPFKNKDKKDEPRLF